MVPRAKVVPAKVDLLVATPRATLPHGAASALKGGGAAAQKAAASVKCAQDSREVRKKAKGVIGQAVPTTKNACIRHHGCGGRFLLLSKSR